MQTPYELGDKMELVLFAVKEHFFITKITEFRDGAGFPFKIIEIGKVEKQKAQPQLQPKKEGPVFTVRTPQLPGSRTSTPKKQIAGGAAQLPAGKVTPKAVAANGTKQVSANGTKQVAGSGTKQVAGSSTKQVAGSTTKQVAGSSTKQVTGSKTKQLSAGAPKKISANESKKLAARDASFLPAGKKR
ncbi:bacteriophage T4 gp5 trimerisation domain-containing protein [Methanimicrococcus blatticola]|uniref:Uncharacterized protein n=1 Tax=Methanimicrococcus blatticola TaxID=91560 RepID=A0A484F5N0_9EURY|nr:hypothetical protein [Methanimicrococcus blatticola]MBZ3934915.1 hypothetical protein [Methanimicrococcus blatticola]MCC2508986.1 hypothetical protein [Methanimicrococcus blatticola]TDQ70984.1 hypothetical protein C7391_0082 [Methanimicrococcus blatticola]